MKWLGILVTLIASNVVIAQENHNEILDFMKPGLSFESATKPGDGSTKIVGLKYTDGGIDYLIGTDVKHSEYGLKRKIVDRLCVALGFKGVVNFFKEEASGVDIAYLAQGSTSDYDYGEAKLSLRKNQNAFVINNLLCYSGEDLSDIQVRTAYVDEKNDTLVVTDPTIIYEGVSHPMIKPTFDHYNHGVCIALGYKKSFVNSMTCGEKGPASANFDNNGFVVNFQANTIVGSMNGVGSGACRISKLTCETKIKEVSYKVLE